MERVLWITSISANTLEGLDPTISIWSCGVLARFGPWAECVVIYTRLKRTPLHPRLFSYRDSADFCYYRATLTGIS